MKIMNIKKNDIIELEITGMTAEGSGVGKTDDGIAVFVPNSAIGDRAEVLILKVLKNYCFGKIVKLISPSPDRQEVDCPVFSKCGGCCYRHITYNAELKIKEQKVRDAVTRIGGLDIEIQPIVPSEKIDHYRNKAQLPIAKNKNGFVELGFYGFHSHRVIDIASCQLQPEIFDRIMTIVKDFLIMTNQPIYDETAHTGKIRHLYIRCGEKTGEIMVCLVVNGKDISHKEELVNSLKENIIGLTSVVINSNTEKTNVIMGKTNTTVYNSDRVTDELCGMKFRLSPNSFYQVNRSQAEKLYQKAKEYAQLSKDDILVDLYCGTGTIGLTMARECKNLIGVEIIPDAVKDAEQNARMNGIENAEFICGDATRCAKKLSDDNLRPNVVIVDPPRKGLTPKLIETVVKMSPQRIVYISCDPATLARDLKLFTQKSYLPQTLTPYDLFPRTSHVETVVLLSRNNIDDHLEFTWTDKEFGTKGSRATYPDIQAYIHEKYGLKVSYLNIAQIKRKCGIIERENYNLPKSEKSKQPGCTKEREDAIMDAFRYFQMI